MSGPKVVRVVSREEVEARCRRWLLLVGTAAADLASVAGRLERMDAGLRAEVDARCSVLEGLMQEERWIDLQKEAPSAIEHFRHEAERLKAEAVAAAAAARSKRRRILDAARSVAASLEVAGRPVPSALSEAASRSMAASDDELDGLRAAVEAGISSLGVPISLRASSAEQRGLAARLDAGDHPRTLADWLQANAASDPQGGRLDALLSELAGCPSAPDARALAARAAAIAEEPSADTRSLLTDSLILEVGRHVREMRAVEAALGRCAAVRAELAAESSEASRGRRSAVDAAMAARDPEAMRAVADAGEAHLEAARRNAAAVARRSAVLEGLASLGYEVREGMEAAWARDGRVVVRRPGIEDYGVELAAPADASRLQTRLVGSDRPRVPRNAARDKDQETIWCGQFDHLRALVAESGASIQVERAIAPGEQAVKTVAMPLVPAASVEAELPRSGRSQARPIR